MMTIWCEKWTKLHFVNVPVQKVSGITKTGNYQLIPELLMKVIGFTFFTEKITIAGPPVFLCHETSPESVKEANEKGMAVVEVGSPIAGTVKGSDEIKAYELPGGKMVRTIRRGPYADCEPTYLSLFAWIGKEGLTINGPNQGSIPKRSA